MYKLNGVVQNYAWGGKYFIPALLNKELSGEKFAEYWLGAHNNAPSVISNNGRSINLNDFIKDDSEANLGVVISQKFGRLPFLFKVLDVHDMLSIQVHPSKKEAVKGFARENEMGIPLTAVNRNYKDDNHKPEIMVALSEFWLLHGFLPKEKLVHRLKITPELSHLVAVFLEEGYKGLYQFVMEESKEDTNRVLQPLIDRIVLDFEQQKLDKSTSEYWAAKAYKTFCSCGDLDKGIYSIFFFNIIKAQPGEAVFQDAGIPHAYLEGQNMELMANSDNVLRGGLTPKHVDVSELLKHVNFNETIPNILKGDLQEDGIERIYKSPAPDFELSQLVFSNKENSYNSKSNTSEIFMVFKGEVDFRNSEGLLHLIKGEAVFISANSEYSISSDKDAVLYKATAP